MTLADNRRHDDGYLDRPLFGAQAIGDELDLKRHQVYRMARLRLLDVDHCGRWLVSTRRRLRNQFRPREAAAE